MNIEIILHGFFIQFIGDYFPYLLGLIVSIYIADKVLYRFSSNLWEYILDDNNENNYLFTWFSRVVGNVERILYYVAFLYGKSEFIGFWLAFKVIGRWEKSKIEFTQQSNIYEKFRAHAVYNIFTISNALSIFYAAFGWILTDKIKQCHYKDAVMILIGVLIISIVLVVISYRQSREIRHFSEKYKP